MNFNNLNEKWNVFLNKNFDIIDGLIIQDYDRDFNLLRKRLKPFVKDFYNQKEKFIVHNFDTDYYDFNQFKYGVFLYNFFAVFYELDIPFFTIVFLTMQNGLTNEIYKLCKEVYGIEDKDALPTVIENITGNKIMFPQDRFQNTNVDVDSIIFPAFSIMANNRSHRFALYNTLKQKNLLDKIEVIVKAVEK